ncbi:hypothetical protein BKA64DRAFT_584760 [Cadophora sp. MPI-SDFR-AT-0126]|nr:hypothetical protein BKA64DRAFT_584760 [Leotiomycetes sp. MPI-SDFR-AT-0126]
MIEDTPPYHVLSYCWGEAERSEIIISDKGTVQITPHLQLALAELRSIPDLQTWFWVD